ncbi:MAG: DUF4349 domain-containing protein [Actinomycetales bacterium]|nr:DUF4349 domain-containing protein [Actinomycetales bacterium]
MRIHQGLAGAVLLALALAGCSSAASTTEPAADMASVVESGADGGMEYALDESGEGGGGVERVAATPQHVIVEGYMTVVVDEPTETVSQVTDLVAKAGGYVESRSERAPTEDSKGRATLVLRLPADGVEGTLDAIAALGELADRNTTATDVTMQVTDLDARITALETSIDRLLEMLAAAQRTEDLITIERTLQERQSDLESFKAQRLALGNRVALATIELELTTDPPPPTVGPGGFWPGVVSGWNSLVDTLRGASVVVGVLLPWLVFFGVIAGVVIPLVRRARRRRPPKAARPVAPFPYGGQPVPQPAPAAPQPPAEPEPDASPEAKQAQDGV